MVAMTALPSSVHEDMQQRTKEKSGNENKAYQGKICPEAIRRFLPVVLISHDRPLFIGVLQGKQSGGGPAWPPTGSCAH